MSTVKRYDVESDPQDGPCSLWNVEAEDGEFVAYDDYAALEAERDALAAENAALRVHLKGTVDFCYSELPDTPATDAFMREQMAKGVDAVCLKISNAIPSCGQDEIIGLDAAATICGAFAGQLRAGEGV